MAGNRRAYDAAVKRAASLAWEQKWSKAIEEYNKALAEFPQDVNALTGLGLAYVETRQFREALEAYKQAARQAPDNPEIIQRVGSVYERLAQFADAAHIYVLAGEAAARMRDISQAADLWHQATILASDNLDAHRNLARVYQNAQENSLAAWHHLIMTRVLARQGKFDEATEHAQEAVNLDPRNLEAGGILEALQRGLPLPDGPTARLQPDAEGKRSLDSFVIFEDIEVQGGTMLDAESLASPADMLLNRSLSQMAEALFSDDIPPDQMQAYMLLGQAADRHARGLVDEAIEAYLSALKTGIRMPSIYFNLGLLYKEKRNWTLAIENLKQALNDPELAPGVCYAIGECYQTWNKPDEALPYLLDTLKLLDSQTVRPSQVAELNQAYDRLRVEYAAKNGQRKTLAESILDFLGRKGWGERIVQTRRQMDRMYQDDALVTLGEAMIEPEAAIALESISVIYHYLENDKLFTALEECFCAVRQSPYYLPLHLCMADILVREGRLDEAAQKYRVVAQTYHIRENLHQATRVYRKALAIAPMNVTTREQLISIFMQTRQMDQVIEQYIAIADIYYQLAQVDQALESYEKALTYAPQSDPERHWEVNILHRMGDIYTQRVDWRQALKVYQRILRQEPQDERARFQVVDMFYKLGQANLALEQIDAMIEFYKANSLPTQLVSAIQLITRAHPQEMSLHMRFAKACLDMRLKDQAIAELDAVGEIQVQQGKTQDAIRTIQAIIRLGPANVDQYKQLLAQLARR